MGHDQYEHGQEVVRAELLANAAGGGLEDGRHRCEEEIELFQR